MGHTATNRVTRLNPMSYAKQLTTLKTQLNPVQLEWFTSKTEGVTTDRNLLCWALIAHEYNGIQAEVDSRYFHRNLGGLLADLGNQEGRRFGPIFVFN